MPVLRRPAETRASADPARARNRRRGRSRQYQRPDRAPARSAQHRDRHWRRRHHDRLAASRHLSRAPQAPPSTTAPDRSSPSTIATRGSGRSLLSRHCQNAIGRAARIGGAEIADDPDLVAQARRKHRPDEAVQRRVDIRARNRAGARACDNASVRSASVSNIRKRGPSRCDSASTTGPAASVRSPAKPAAAAI